MRGISERIRGLLSKKKLSDKDIAAVLDVSPQRISQKISSDNWDSLNELQDIAEFLKCDFNWLAFGTNTPPTAQEPEVKGYGVEVKRIPFYDVEATGGINGGDVSPVSAPTGTIDIGDILRDSEAAIRMAGNSMMPGYPPGCVLGLIPKRNKSIIPGEVYVYEDEDGRHCKRLFYKNDDPASDTYVCYSDTTTRFESGARKDKLFYPPYELKILDIVRLFTVTGVVKRNTNGVINYKKQNGA
jgi:transcriptional regulator with XRE-family HTH domain